MVNSSHGIGILQGRQTRDARAEKKCAEQKCDTTYMYVYMYTRRFCRPNGETEKAKASQREIRSENKSSSPRQRVSLRLCERPLREPRASLFFFPMWILPNRSSPRIPVRVSFPRQERCIFIACVWIERIPGFFCFRASFSFVFLDLSIFLLTAIYLLFYSLFLISLFFFTSLPLSLSFF